MTMLLGTASLLAVNAAGAADLVVDLGTIVQPNTELPAVSGVNGKWEFDPGFLSGGGMVRGAGSISLPLGDRFGLQADGMGTWTSNNGLIYGGALHAFTRDPSRYLAGVTAGFVVSQQATLAAVGGEGELYLDQLSLEGWAGVAGLNYVDPMLADKLGVFAIGDAAFYPDPNVRLAVGGSYVLGDLSVHSGAEYMFHGFGMPLSATADARLHGNGAYSFTVGLKGYFGGNDDGKSLIDRQRQDDPRNRAVDLFAAAGSQMFDKSTPAPGPGPVDLEAECRARVSDDPQVFFMWENNQCVEAAR